MRCIDLCDPEQEGVVLPALPARNSPRKNDEGPHVALQVRREADAYLTLGECEELVYATLAHLQKSLEAQGRLFGAQAVQSMKNIPLSWIKSTSRHGVCKSKRELGIRPAWSFSIEFSRPVFEHTNLEGRIQTVIHEACHVVATLLGDRGHGNLWKSCMVKCGLKPDVKAEAVAALAPHLVCPKCGRTSSVSTATAARLAHGTSGGLVCPGCGTRLNAEQLVIPDSMAKRVKSAASKITAYECACGLKIQLTPKHIRAMAKGATYRCKCGKDIRVIGVLPS